MATVIQFAGAMMLAMVASAAVVSFQEEGEDRMTCFVFILTLGVMMNLALIGAWCLVRQSGLLVLPQ